VELSFYDERLNFRTTWISGKETHRYNWPIVLWVASMARLTISWISRWWKWETIVLNYL